MKTLSLPGEYVNFPAVSCKTDQLSVQQLAFSDEGAGKARLRRKNGLNMACTYSPKDKLMNEDYISWAAFHSSLELNPPNPPAIIALLPLFYEKAATLYMVKHGMDVVQSITSHINPGQIPVIALDKPLFALAKCVGQRHMGRKIALPCLGNYRTLENI